MSSGLVWRKRELLFDVPGATVLKVTVLPTKIAAILQQFYSFATEHISVSCVADATGIVTLAFVAPPARTTAIVDSLSRRLHSDGGAVVVLRARPGSPEFLEPWGSSQPTIGVMRAIKQQFDPQQLLNPGKFVGGI